MTDLLDVLIVTFRASLWIGALVAPILYLGRGGVATALFVAICALCLPGLFRRNHSCADKSP